jgi:hypothetical protein
VKIFWSKFEIRLDGKEEGWQGNHKLSDDFSLDSRCQFSIDLIPERLPVFGGESKNIS